jgi:hypothetical protein
VQDCELIKPTTCQFLTLELKSMVSSTFMEALMITCPQFTRSFNNHWSGISICLIMSPMSLSHLLTSGDELVWTSEFTKKLMKLDIITLYLLFQIIFNFLKYNINLIC